MTLTQEQLAQRKRGIGASDLWKLFNDPHALWLEKRGLVDPEPENDFMRWGKLVEPLLIEEAQRRLGLPVVKCEQTLVGAEPWMMATPDGLVLNEAGDVIGLVEAKTAAGWKASEWGDEGTDDIPNGYMMQVQWQLLVGSHVFPYLTRPTDVIVELNHQLRMYASAPHLALQAALVRKAREFWRYVESGDPPPIDGSESAKQTLLTLFPPRERKEWGEATEDDLALIEQYQAAKDAALKAQARESLLKQRLCERIGPRYGLRIDEKRSVSWGFVKGRQTTDWKGIVAALNVDAGTIAKHTKTGEPTRRFLANLGGGDA